MYFFIHDFHDEYCKLFDNLGQPETATIRNNSSSGENKHDENIVTTNTCR